MICLGHPQSALIELVKNYPVGLVLTENNPAALARQLLEGLVDFSSFDQYRTESLRCAETEFNAERNRTKLQTLLYSDGEN